MNKTLNFFALCIAFSLLFISCNESSIDDVSESSISNLASEDNMVEDI